MKSDFAIIDISRFNQEQLNLIEGFIRDNNLIEKVILVN